jgi:hypothetical protein
MRAETAASGPAAMMALVDQRYRLMDACDGDNVQWPGV